ncbi:MAG: sigma-70 family RNA polymerase sigma factor [Acetobacter sp.]|nr:sigma-70 family RNA polymerase sigma factor [Bacteroides sp.]MCM1342148.1 sigma-70 family RNA polymerase sigma factor [Acetobacter sp.]MCM1434376.1 sigma-70 family RNA polymerase sigma factor [Clostridiales bacterium]
MFEVYKKCPVFENDEHEKAWFIRVTLNCCKTSMKSFWKTKISPLDESYTDSSFDELPINNNDLSFALKQLSKKHRAVIHLFYYEDLSTKDIASALNMNENNVRMNLTRARRELKKILEREKYI